MFYYFDGHSLSLILGKLYLSSTLVSHLPKLSVLGLISQSHLLVGKCQKLGSFRDFFSKPAYHRSGYVDSCFFGSPELVYRTVLAT